MSHFLDVRFMALGVVLSLSIGCRSESNVLSDSTSPNEVERNEVVEERPHDQIASESTVIDSDDGASSLDDALQQFDGLASFQPIAKEIEEEKVSFETDDLSFFQQITKGMEEGKVRHILKDFQCVSVGSGFAIDSYTLSDQSVVKIWYRKGRVLWMRHNDDPMIE